MARVRVGLSCSEGHFNYFGDLWDPVKDTDLDKLAERSAVPATCGKCGSRAFGLPHVEGRDREQDRRARVGGRNVSAPIQSRPKERPREGPLTPLAWKRKVFDQQRESCYGPALCAVTGEPLDFVRDDAHHVLDKRLLRARGLYALVWDARNGMFIKADVHLGQTNGLRRITRDKIPAAAWAFVREIGEWAVQRLEEDYPLPVTTTNR